MAVILPVAVAHALLSFYVDGVAKFKASMPLALHGSQRIHLTSEEVALYREISLALDRNCKSFVTLPGMHSFYFWSGQKPPGGLNVTLWRVLSDDLQQRTLAELDTLDGLCVLRNNRIESDFFPRSAQLPESSLSKFVRERFAPFMTFAADYELLKRAPSSDK